MRPLPPTGREFGRGLVTALILLSLNPGSLVAAAQDIGPHKQKTSTPASVPVSVPTTPAHLPSLAGVRVMKVYRIGEHLPQSSREPVRAAIGDRIGLMVADLDSLVRHAKCTSAADVVIRPCETKRITLFLGGREIRGIQPESGAPLPEDARLEFHLHRSTDSVNNEAWADLLGDPGRGRHFYVKPAEVSVGLEDGYPLPSDVGSDQFELIRLDRRWFIPCAVGLALVLVLLLALAMRTNILRDVGPRPAEMTVGWIFRKRARKPYSLGRVQMAFWFVLVITSFLFLWLVTGAYDTITPSILALIGIGAGTGLGAAAIDVGKEQTATTRLAELEAEASTQTQEITDLSSKVAGAPADQTPALVAARSEKQARQKIITAEIADLKASAVPRASRGFLLDILQDPTGDVGFHRFQMLVWTLILGLLFVRSTWERLTMPEFGATLLALLGLSAGTYLGFKIPEPKR